MTEQPTVSRRTRDVTMDFAKGLAILLMIHDHIQPLGLVITSFHMPLFFFVSGWFHRDRPLPQTICRRAQSLLLPYLCYSMACTGALAVVLLYMPSLLGVDPAAYGGFSAARLPSFLLRALTDMLFADNSGLLWFLPCLFLVCVLYPFIDRLQQRIARLPAPAASKADDAAASFRMPALSYLIKWFALCVCNVAGYRFHNTGGRQWWYIDVALVSLAFYAAGHDGRKLLSLLRTKRINTAAFRTALFAAAFALWTAAIRGGALSLALRIYGTYPLCIFGAVAGTACILALCRYAARIPLLNLFFCYCGRHTLKILCLSNIILRCTDWNFLFAGWPLSIKFLLQFGVILPLVALWNAIRTFASHNAERAATPAQRTRRNTRTEDHS